MNNLFFLQNQTGDQNKLYQVPVGSNVSLLQNKVSTAMVFFGRVMQYADEKCAEKPGNRSYVWPATHDAPFMELLAEIVSEFKDDFPEQSKKMGASIQAIEIFLRNAPMVRLTDNLLACIVSVLCRMSRSIEKRTGIKMFIPFFMMSA